MISIVLKSSHKMLAVAAIFRLEGWLKPGHRSSQLKDCSKDKVRNLYELSKGFYEESKLQWKTIYKDAA